VHSYCDLHCFCNRATFHVHNFLLLGYRLGGKCAEESIKEYEEE
jgi:hypothetical protein